MRMTSSMTQPVKGCTSSAAVARSSSTTRRARIATRNARECGPPKAPGPGSSHPRRASCSSPCPIAQVRSRRSGCSRRPPERELSHAESSPPPRSPTTLIRLATYFLRLGATGFGGPVALANYMRRDLVEVRGWVSEQEYDSGLAIAAACPGPLAYQLGVYCGYIRFGVAGGLLVAVAFGLAPFLIVVAAAAAYTAFADNWQLRALCYGVGPVVVALILTACSTLGPKTPRRDRVASAFAVLAGGATVVVALGGELAATVRIFSPAAVFAVLAPPLLLRYGQNRRLRGFIRGVTVTVVGVLVGTTYLVARTAIADVLTAAIAVLSLVVLMWWKKCPDPLLVAVGAVIGLAMYRVIRPDWLMH